MARTRIGRYFYNLAYSLDQLGNTLWGGDPDETISSRIGKLARAGKIRPLPKIIMRILGRIDRDHCREAIEEDRGDRAIFDKMARCPHGYVRDGIFVRCRLVVDHYGDHLGEFHQNGATHSMLWRNEVITKKASPGYLRRRIIITG